MSTNAPGSWDPAVDTSGTPGVATGEPPAAEPAKKRKRPLWARLLIWTGVVVLVLSIGAVVGARLLVSRYTSTVAEEPMLGEAAVPEPAKGASPLDGPLNILLIGVDDRADDENGVGTRADSIIVVHINARHDKAYMLSVPRDTLVRIPAFPKTGFTGSHEKINAAFQHGSANGGGRAGGFELLAKTVSQVTGMRFNAGMIANFVGFDGAVNALGGVDMCIDQRVTSIHLNTEGKVLATEGGTAKVYEPGCRHLEPWEALDYVRQRHTKGGDYDRQRHQQQLIKAVMKAALDSGVSDPLTLDRVLTSTGKALTADWGKASMTDWLLTARGIGSDGLTMLRTNGGKYASVRCPNGASCENLTAESKKMFDAARADTLDAFIASHPTWVAPGT